MKCAISGELCDSIKEIILPKICSQCSSRFADKSSLQVHVSSCHQASISCLTSDPKSMGKAALIAALRDRGLDSRGGVTVLRQRLLGALEGED